MATRGFADVDGLLKDGRWVIQPTRGALDVLMRAKAKGEPIEIRLTVPTRGKIRRIKDHNIRLSAERKD